ncbi:MAG: fused MFS/spermidine synthase [Chloroflexota bacterium]|jgi:spermidine synthase
MTDQSKLSENRRETISGRGELYVTVFVAGMATLAVEFTISRMLQTVFGTSNIVWANVIGLVLLFLTVGYFLGGRLADRRPQARPFYWLVSIAGFSSVFFLLLTSVILRQAASALAAVNVGAVLSSLIIVLLSLAVPITLLGCISPYAIRLGVRDVGEAGRISGRIYAVSTWGSLLGTYLPVLIVIPLAGTRVAAVVFGSTLLGVGLLGLWRSKRQTPYAALLMPVILIPVVLGWTQGGIKAYPDQIYEEESAYNYVQVIRRGDCNYLLLNEGQAYHSYYCDRGQVPRISVWSIMLAAPFFGSPDESPALENMAVIGLAAGTIAKQFTRVFGDIAIDGIELDPAIVDAGREYFALNEPNINVIIGDGRYELNQLDKQYDLITLDAYKVPYIPWHLTTREFFREVRNHLTDEGVIAINVGRGPTDRRLVQALTSTLWAVFPSVHTIDVPGSLNSILVASVRPTDSDNLVVWKSSISQRAQPLLLRAIETAQANIVPSVGSDIVFSDQRAQVEAMIDSIVIRYLLEEGPAALPGLGG